MVPWRVANFRQSVSLNASSDWRAPTAANQHGVLGVTATAAGPVNHILADAQYGIGQVDFTVSMRACLDDRASLGYGSQSWVVWWIARWRDPAMPYLWQVMIRPTGMCASERFSTDRAAANCRWTLYDLQIARINQTAYAYIDGALMLTQAYPDNLVNANRQLQLRHPAMPINKGYAVDYHRLGIRR